MSRHSNTGLAGTSDWLMGAVTRNPEGLLLLAAGAALLMRSSGMFQGNGHSTASNRQHGGLQSAGRQGAGRQGTGHQAGRPMAYERDQDWNVAEGATRAAQTARDYASDMTGRVAETASSYASAVSDYATETGRTVAEQSTRYARQAQSTLSETVSHVVQEQPLAIAIAGLAAGAAVAAVFPTTDMERRTLGAAAEKMSDYASETGERLREATYSAGERLLNTVEERGLSTEGFKDVARDVAGSFGSAISGQGSESDQGGQGGGTGSRAASAGGISGGAAAPGRQGGASASGASGMSSGQAGRSGQPGTSGQQSGKSGSTPGTKPGRSGSDVSGSGA